MTSYNGEPYKSVFDSKFYVPAGSISAATSIQTANQLAEVNARLNAGVYGVDLATIQPEIVHSIPKEHFKEIKRLTDLSNATASMHGPMVDLAGFSQNRWDENFRRQVEHEMGSVIEKAHELNPKGNTPVNFHANTQVAGEIKRPLGKEEIEKMKSDLNTIRSKEDKAAVKELIEGGEITDAIGIVNQENGEVSMVKYEVKETPYGKVVYTPEARLRSHNLSEWDAARLRVFELQKQKEERNYMLKKEEEDYKILEESRRLNNLSPDEKRILERKGESVRLMRAHIENINTSMGSALNELYNKANKYLPDELPVVENGKIKEIKKNEVFKDFGNYISNIKDDETRLKTFATFVGSLPAPEVWTPTNKFAKEKTSETIANTAFNAYQKFGESTPIITLENYQQDLTIGSGEDIKETIERSRDLFVKKLVDENKMTKKEANDTAKKIIGVTWDVGHINFLRRKGYSEEEIMKQTKAVAPYVKQVHITDNFGFHDAHLPPGMGNAPISQQLDVLKKDGFKVDKKGSLIVEGGGWVQQFKENPHLYTLDEFRSPLYKLKVEPSWYQIRDVPGAYGAGLGNVYPEVHFKELYGTSFATLPRELGGQFPGEKSRFAGTPNA